MTNRFCPSLAVAAVVLLQPASSSAQNVEALTTCGQVMTHKIAILEGDLDCSAQQINEPTVKLRPGGVLDLRGFTLTSRSMTTVNIPTVECTARCAIRGPGTIVGSALPGAGGLVVSFEPYESSGRLTVIDATITGGQVGLAARRIELIRSTVTGAREIGVLANKVDLLDSEVSANGTAAEWTTVGDSGGAGVLAGSLAKVTTSSITGNGIVGVIAPKVKVTGTMLVDSVITGNDVHANCGATICADIGSERRLQTDQYTVCDRSIKDGEMTGSGIGSPLPITEDWDTCTLD